MSLTAVRTLFRERLEGLGFTEHDQPFQPFQIGETIVDDSFHMETGTVISSAANQTVHSFEFPIIIRIYKKGYINVLQAYDEIHQTADEILADLLNQTVRIGDPVKDIVPQSINILPMDDSNDNILVLELSFTARLELCYIT